ncbi:MAG TPA: hypothetical protein VFP26_07085 [Gemmatimonadaceae bacterium]|nr:hypothetical protein [Gemmatimonadaceae bacterium]
MIKPRSLAHIIVSVLFAASAVHAQTPSKDPSTRLREVLPTDVAQRVLARIADARARQLPAEALENRALKFAAKGVAPADIERSVSEQIDRMEAARTALVAGRREAPEADEIEAGAEVMRKGVDGQAVSALARSAPSGRSLAVPLFVIGSLTDRGVPAAQALQRVMTRLQQKASDADLETLPADVSGASAEARGSGNNNGRGNQGRNGVSGRPATAGPPAGVPGNGGKKTNPGQSHRPPKPTK